MPRIAFAQCGWTNNSPAAFDTTGSWFPFCVPEDTPTTEFPLGVALTKMFGWYWRTQKMTMRYQGIATMTTQVLDTMGNPVTLTKRVTWDVTFADLIVCDATTEQKLVCAAALISGDNTITLSSLTVVQWDVWNVDSQMIVDGSASVYVDPVSSVFFRLFGVLNAVRVGSTYYPDLQLVCIMYPRGDETISGGIGDGAAYMSINCGNLEVGNAPDAVCSVDSSSFNVPAQAAGTGGTAIITALSQTITVSTSKYWEYRDSNGANPIWNSTTGAQLITPVPSGL